MPNRTARAMTANEVHLVGPFHQLFLDRGDQRCVVAAGEVGAAYAAGKQHIADMGEFRGFVVEDDMARCVAGAVEDLE